MLIDKPTKIKILKEHLNDGIIHFNIEEWLLNKVDVTLS